MAGLSSYNIQKDIIQSINKNIIGTANVVSLLSINKANLYVNLLRLSRLERKLTEKSALKPISYAWSKLGGECAVMLYKNSLILRTVTKNLFVHKGAFSDLKLTLYFMKIWF